MCGLVRILCLLGIMALLLPVGYHGESVEGGDDLLNPAYGDYYHGNASAPRLLRFRDFEPREPRHVAYSLADDPLPGVEREGRGFHFHASGEDVSVELEFIVPFVKVPVKRSMKMARDAVQSLLNLRTGAILNTAVVVAAGAVIAAVVRLLLAPLVITSLGNGYGYKSDKGRGMRRLTDVVESQLEEHNIDMTVCVQQLICQYLQRNLASGYARVLNVLASSSWLPTSVHGTAVFQAIQASRSSRSCSHTFRSCRWPKHLNLTSGSLPQILQFFNG